MPDPIPTSVFICILPTPSAPALGRGRVVIQRVASRRALALAAAGAGAPEGPWSQEEDGGRPLPMDGWHWSVTHDAHFVGAVVARVPVGIDTEEITLRREALIQRVLDESEQSVLEGPEKKFTFTRAWCAKEAVLKATGIGMAGLSRCKILTATGPRLTLRLDKKDWTVVQRRGGKSIFAVTAEAEPVDYDWSLCELTFDPWNEA